MSIAFSPDEKKLASVSEDMTVQLWDVETGTGIGSALEGHDGWVSSIVFSPNGNKLAFPSEARTLCLWDVKIGTAIGSPLEGHSGNIASIVFSPDGQKLASRSYDGTVCLWILNWVFVMKSEDTVILEGMILIYLSVSFAGFSYH